MAVSGRLLSAYEESLLNAFASTYTQDYGGLLDPAALAASGTLFDDDSLLQSLAQTHQFPFASNAGLPEVPSQDPYLEQGDGYLTAQAGVWPDFEQLPLQSAAGLETLADDSPVHPQFYQGMSSYAQLDSQYALSQQERQANNRHSQKGLEDNVKRTVFVSRIHQSVTEQELAAFFQECGQVVDCRICGDPHSRKKFAFIEFSEISAAQRALSKSRQPLGGSLLCVRPSKTAIEPLNKELMAHNHDELERCRRTVYVSNIDKAVGANVKVLFEQVCGPVTKIKVLHSQNTCSALVEFEDAKAAAVALNCSGIVMGSLRLRVSASKTPVRLDQVTTYRA